MDVQYVWADLTRGLLKACFEDIPMKKGVSDLGRVIAVSLWIRDMKGKKSPHIGIGHLVLNADESFVRQVFSHTKDILIAYDAMISLYRGDSMESIWEALTADVMEPESLPAAIPASVEIMYDLFSDLNLADAKNDRENIQECINYCESILCLI